MKNLHAERLFLLSMLAACGTTAHATLRPVADIVDLSLEQLTRITVSSVSRREEAILDAPPGRT